MIPGFPLLLTLLAGDPSAVAGRPFAIEVVDDRTGRGVPLVELRTVHGIRLVTDSNGIAAFDEPGLMDQPAYFHIKSHGYEYPKDGFGFRGKALDVRGGGAARLEIRRINIAERLYRVTGAGIYRDSLLVGKATPIRHPDINARVVGSDSVVNTLYRGKLRWFWGDTNRPDYPLGNFHSPGATSLLPSQGGLDPDRGVDLDYLTGPDGFARPTARMPGDGPTWIDGLVVLGQTSGKERMFVAYAKIRNLLDVYERGLAEFDDVGQRFEKVVTFARDVPIFPAGHTSLRRSGGVDYVYFETPYPLTRVRADPEDLAHPERYEAYTCLVPGGRMDRPRIDRGPDGLPRYAWKRDTPPFTAADQARLIKTGLLKPGEGLLQLQDAQTGKRVVAHAGSVAWNPYRKRWVLITVETGGTSFLGEVWFAEADTPLGPWVYARKVVTHEAYSFYNPKQHPEFARDDGRILYFEGTYSQTFSGNPDATPRYDYNQVMYRLDLSDERLNLPVPVYRAAPPDVALHLGQGRPPGARIAFFALPRPAQGTVPVVETRAEGGGRTLIAGGSARGDGTSIFHALAADTKSPPPTTASLVELVEPDGSFRRELVEEPSTGTGERRAARPVCRVWKNPISLALPEP